MRFIEAAKYHGYGNDFLIVPAESVPETARPGFARSICDPHFGIGADGCVFLSVQGPEVFDARIFNQDGSETGMSGNGIRCAAAFLHHKNWTDREKLEIRTPSGRKIYTLIEASQLRWTYRSLMGEPVFSSTEIPFGVEPPLERVQDFPLDVRGETVRVTALWVGNPQCVVFVDELPEGDRFLRVGSALECHPMFPRRTNVSFVKVEGPNQIRIRIFERGVGPTHSSGTGSCGAAVASLIGGKVQSPVEVTTATGTQTVEWEPGQEIVLTGAADLVGEVNFCWRTGD